MTTNKDLQKYKALMVKSNYIIESSYKLNLQEQRLIYILTTKINKDDIQFTPYKFTQTEVNSILLKHKISFNDLKQHINSLRNKELVIVKEESTLETKWLSSAEYFKDGSIELCFDDKLKPYLLQLKERFTKVSMDMAITFNSNYSCRIYELLKQYEVIGGRSLSIEKLRTMFRIEPHEYARYNDFKRKVLLQAQKEINLKNTDISFSFEEIKTGRKVTSIKFKIKTNKVKNQAIDEISATSVVKFTKKEQNYFKRDIKEVQVIFRENISEKDAESLLNSAKGNVNMIKDKYAIPRKSDVENIVGWVLKAIKEDYKVPKGKTNVGGFNDFEQRKYNFDNLEENLLGKNNDDKTTEEDNMSWEEQLVEVQRMNMSETSTAG